MLQNLKQRLDFIFPEITKLTFTARRTFLGRDERVYTCRKNSAVWVFKDSCLLFFTMGHCAPPAGWMTLNIIIISVALILEMRTLCAPHINIFLIHTGLLGDNTSVSAATAESAFAESSDMKTADSDAVLFLNLLSVSRSVWRKTFSGGEASGRQPGRVPLSSSSSR